MITVSSPHFSGKKMIERRFEKMSAALGNKSHQLFFALINAPE